MTKQKHIPDNNTTISESNQLSVACEPDYFDLIPLELFINILRKIPVKSLAKSRCVSKQWSSIIRRQNLPIKSLAPPRLLCAQNYSLRDRQKWVFCSALEPKKPDNDSSISLNLETSGNYKICSNVGGFVCIQYFEKKCSFAVILNPITGELVTTPKLTLLGFESTKRFYLGYDPIEKEYKVLCMTLSDSSHKYQVLTLGTGCLTWRNMQCRIHYPQKDDNGICINGVLYYLANVNGKNCVIVCFDVMFEIFSFISIDHYMTTTVLLPMNLIDYKGKLGVINYERYYDYFELWVLEDAEEQKWSKHKYVLPAMPHLCLKSMSALYHSGEIGFYSNSPPYHSKMFLYNLEKNTFRTVVVQEVFMYGRVDIIPNFIEDLNLI